MDKIKNMFVVDPTICSFKNGESVKSVFGDKAHRFNISNKDTKDEISGNIIEGKDRFLISEIIYRLSDPEKTTGGIMPGEIKEFLNYHYQRATNKNGLITFMKSDIWVIFNKQMSAISPEGKNEILDWITSTKDEPTVMVKAWIVYFEKGGDEKVMDSIKRISDKRGWNGSCNTVKNSFDAAYRIHRGETKAGEPTQKQKEDLFTAISLLSDYSKDQASKLYSKLK